MLNDVSVRLECKIFRRSEKFFKLHKIMFTVASLDSVDPDVGVFSTIKLSNPVSMVDTDHAGFLKKNCIKKFFYR